MSIKDHVNDEELLQMALQLVNFDESLDEGKPGELIVAYVIDQFTKEGKEWTDEDVEKEYSKLVWDYVVESLGKKGKIDFYINDEGEIVYTLPPDEEE